MSEIPLDDQKEFEAWLLARWLEKDQLLDHCFETGRFPTALAGSIEADSVPKKQQIAAADGYAETPVRLGHWTEVVQIFAPMVGLAVACKLLSCCR